MRAQVLVGEEEGALDGTYAEVIHRSLHGLKVALEHQISFRVELPLLPHLANLPVGIHVSLAFAHVRSGDGDFAHLSSQEAQVVALNVIFAEDEVGVFRRLCLVEFVCDLPNDLQALGACIVRINIHVEHEVWNLHLVAMLMVVPDTIGDVPLRILHEP